MTTEHSQRFFHGLLAASVAALIGAIAYAFWNAPMAIDPTDAALVAVGQGVYASHCAACHGANLEGQPRWRERLPNRRMPAPPHDASGHTWHHPDDMLFGITKYGLIPGKYAPPGYESDMPAFGDTLTDKEIRAVLAYIKSTWPDRERAYQIEIDRKARALR